MLATTTLDRKAEIQPDEIEALRGRLRGEVLHTSDADYEHARRLWNGMIDKRPALIVRCEGVADVIDAVGFARARGLPVSVRGGGHGVAGSALVDDGLVVDLSRMNGIRVDPEARTARAEGGVTLGELDRETQAFGLATPLGVVTKTGIAGLTLFGGIGWLRRKHGLTADNLLSLDVVTGDERLLTASETENADLFWALRGGGGSFGVVTSFEYRLHPVGPDVMFAVVYYPGERAAEVLRFADEYTQAVSDEVSPQAILGRIPHADAFPVEFRGQPYVALAAMYAGDPAEGQCALAPLRELGDAIADLSGVMPYREAQAILDEDYPDGWRYYWKSVDLQVLDEEVRGRLAHHAAQAPSHHSTIDVWFHGGAMDRFDADATAFGARPKYLIGVEANWDEPALDETNVTWAREAVGDLRSFSGGGSYLNFPGFFEEDEEMLRASYGETNYNRLVTLKDQYDPANLFCTIGGIRSSVTSS
jgi:FAD/FMN-containing dehydrogenase